MNMYLMDEIPAKIDNHMDMCHDCDSFILFINVFGNLQRRADI